MQCKDIANEDFLNAVRTASRLAGGGWAMAWDVGCVLAGNPEHVTMTSPHRDTPTGECFPWRLLRAKAQKLINKGLLEGCACGCRGDYYIPGEWPVDERIEVPVAKLDLRPVIRAINELNLVMQHGLVRLRDLDSRIKRVSRIRSEYRSRRGRRRFR